MLQDLHKQEWMNTALLLLPTKTTLSLGSPCLPPGAHDTGSQEAAHTASACCWELGGRAAGTTQWDGGYIPAQHYGWYWPCNTLHLLGCTMQADVTPIMITGVPLTCLPSSPETLNRRQISQKALRYFCTMPGSSSWTASLLKFLHLKHWWCI